MNVNQILNMFLKLVMRKAMSKGIDAGINMASKKQPKQKGAPQPDLLSEEDGISPEERAAMKQRQQEIRKARQAARAARKSSGL